MNNLSNTSPSLVSAIVPAYNCAGSIEATVASLQKQTLPSDALEIILVNDGSSDETLAVCERLAASDPRIVVIDKPNGGVGSARNAGIAAARGRYIAFLDADDTLLPETLEAAVSFFDDHYDEVDLVTYPMRLYNEHREWPHVREHILTESGVYDLTKLQNAFALITNVNVVVKNDAELPHFREDLLVHEDELFFLNVLLRKQKVGFSKAGAYRYYQHPGSAIATKMHPYYQLEDNIGFWEELFSRYEGTAPLYLQASFLNELNWKIRKDVLFPYHYDPETFKVAVNRIWKLLARVDDDVIMIAPRSDEFYQHFFMKKKMEALGSQLSCSVGSEGFRLLHEDASLLCRRSVLANITKTRQNGSTLYLEGVLESVLFEYCNDAQLFLLCDGKVDTPLRLLPTSFDFHEGHTKTNRFYTFAASLDLQSSSTYSFCMRISGSKTTELPVRLTFSRYANLDPDNGITSFNAGKSLVAVTNDGIALHISSKANAFIRTRSRLANTWRVRTHNRKAFAIRAALALRKQPNRPIWLYYDRAGIENGNAYLQFLHDINQNDGINRFYITKDDQGTITRMFAKEQRNHVLGFASARHRLLHLRASRIIASHIEHANWCPFAAKTMRGLADLIHYDIIYLQHGVLHAHMPWKYSADRLPADYEVVSTTFEESNLTSNYRFAPSRLIPSGMPRYDRIDAQAPAKRKILLAPSWRKYLVSEQPGLRFEAKEGAFASSSFWRETHALLSNPLLASQLEQYGFELDVKLHPIFSVYRSFFEPLQTDRIHLADSVRESDYAIVITDWSSWVYDFVYLKRAILYFVPDHQEFRAGMNGYHELDLPLEEGFGPVAHNANELLNALESLLSEDARPQQPYAQRMEGFFLHYDNHQRDRLYQSLMDSWKAKSV